MGWKGSVDFYDRDGNRVDGDRWAQLLGDISYKHVALTAIGKTIEVSTVWLGIDHNFYDEGPPLIFETMVFGGPLDQDTRRWPNIDAAQAGHDQMVAAVREAVGQPINDNEGEL